MVEARSAWAVFSCGRVGRFSTQRATRWEGFLLTRRGRGSSHRTPGEPWEDQNHGVKNTTQGHHRFAPETIEFPLSKKQTKWPIELWTLKQEMETDEDHTTMRESFSLVQNILFIKYTDIFTANFVFFMTYSGGNFWCPYLWSSPDTKVHEKMK